jgi:hypothetical protein
VLARLSKTISTNAAIGGVALLVLGAGGSAATLTAGSSPNPTPDSHASSKATQHTADDADEADEATENESDATEGTRPTDTHGYCVSQVAKAETTSTEPGAHGKAVSAAAHACGKDGAASQADAHRQNGKHGKGLGKNHGTGRPAGVTPGSAAPR